MDGPWLIDISPWHSPSATTGGFNREQSTAYLGGGSCYGGGTGTDSLSWDVPLTAGTWSFTLLYQSRADSGDYTVKFDSTTLGTINGYSVATIPNVVAQITGVVVSANAIVRLTIASPTKNGSASAYYMKPIHITLNRTA